MSVAWTLASSPGEVHNPGTPSHSPARFGNITYATLSLGFMDIWQSTSQGFPRSIPAMELHAFNHDSNIGPAIHSCRITDDVSLLV